MLVGAASLASLRSACSATGRRRAAWGATCPGGPGARGRNLRHYHCPNLSTFSKLSESDRFRLSLDFKGACFCKLVASSALSEWGGWSPSAVFFHKCAAGNAWAPRPQPLWIAIARGLASSPLLSSPPLLLWSSPVALPWLSSYPLLSAPLLLSSRLLLFLFVLLS